MRLQHLFPEMNRPSGQLIATFGNARLIKRWDSGFDLVGGSYSDRHEAQEWISLFLHEAVPSRDPQSRPHWWERR
jgi:hypothetical protein